MPPAEIIDTIRQVHAGKKCISADIAMRLAEHIDDESLSDREVQVLSQVAAAG